MPFRMTLSDLAKYSMTPRRTSEVMQKQTVQEAQLPQRERATLRVIEYFAKSLKVIRNDTVE